jgi:hypothetical protein
MPALAQRCEVAVTEKQDRFPLGGAPLPVHVDDVAHEGDMVARWFLMLGYDHEFKGCIDPFYHPAVLKLLRRQQMEAEPLGFLDLVPGQIPRAYQTLALGPWQELSTASRCPRKSVRGDSSGPWR